MEIYIVSSFECVARVAVILPIEQKPHGKHFIPVPFFGLRQNAVHFYAFYLFGVGKSAIEKIDLFHHFLYLCHFNPQLAHLALGCGLRAGELGLGGTFFDDPDFLAQEPRFVTNAILGFPFIVFPQ